ncbi:EAL domain-containing protein [Mycoplasmatota bacterium WC30]
MARRKRNTIKRRNTVKKNSLINRIVSLTVFLDALFLILVLSGAVLLYYINYNKTRDVNALFQSQIFESSVNDTFDEIISDTHNLANDEDIINYLNYINAGNPAIIDIADPNYDIYAKYLLQTESVMTYQEDNIYDLVYVASETECSIGTDGCAITYDGVLSFADWNISDRPWYTTLGENNAVLTNPYIDGLTGEYVLSYVEKVFDGDTFIGYVAIDVKYSSLATRLSDIHTENIQEANEILVFSDIAGDTKTIYCSGQALDTCFMSSSADFPSIDQAGGFPGEGINYIYQNYNPDESQLLNAFNDKFLVIYTDIEVANITLVTLFYANQLFQIEIIFAILVFIAAIVIFLIAIFINKSVKRSLSPIDDIVNSIEEIKNGNYEVYVDIKENNELQEIGDAINLMSDEIALQVKKTYDSLAYDKLTGLKNRSSATSEIDATIFKSSRKSAVCLIQVENLKNINVTKGQMIGDNLIKAIADELKIVLKTGDTLFSNGGNEFIYIKEKIQSLESVEYSLTRLLRHFKEPLVVKNIKTEVKFFIGVSVYPSDGTTLDELIKKCDTALFTASENGNKKVIFYNDKIARTVSYQAEVSEQLSQAIKKEQLYLKYQPLITNKNEIYGFEALARWLSPSLGEIGPQVFIANAEESYLIIPIGTWILKQACLAQVALRKKLNKEYVISVNVSPVQILQKDFTDIVRKIIKETDISPEFLTLEITESVFIEATVVLEDTIEELHSMGVKLSLDDFGTGYASLTYLRQINFDNLKIDKTFVDGIFANVKDHRIIGTIVDLVHNLDMKVIAEGVETKKQYEYLKQISTDIFQGYIFSKPVTLEELYVFIEKFYKVAKSRRIDVFASLNEGGGL